MQYDSREMTHIYYQIMIMRSNSFGSPLRGRLPCHSAVNENSGHDGRYHGFQPFVGICMKTLYRVKNRSVICFYAICAVRPLVMEALYTNRDDKSLTTVSWEVF